MLIVNTDYKTITSYLHQKRRQLHTIREILPPLSFAELLDVFDGSPNDLINGLAREEGLMSSHDNFVTSQ